MPASRAPEHPETVPDFSATQAAANLAISVRWLRELAQTGRVPHYRIGRRVTFSAAHLAEIRAMAEVRPQPLPATRARRRRAC